MDRNRLLKSNIYLNLEFVMLTRIILLVMIFCLLIGCQQGTQQPMEVKPYKTGFLKVSEIHKIYYQLGGNPTGTPVMYLHGGPGAGCSPRYFKYFNLDVFNVILHDQRGAGKSKPFADIRENTTQYLVEDIEKLRLHLNLDKVILIGGSWGSTLALAYAETYPDRVSGIVLRGVFTSTQAEIDHFYHGGVSKFFPEEFEKLSSNMEDPRTFNYPAQLLNAMQSSDSLTRAEYARLWAEYEGKIAFLHVEQETIDGWFKFWDPLAFSVIENYYMSHKCFLKEGQLLDNTDKIAHIPTVIVNGRYDVICPPITAYKLHNRLRRSKLVIVEKAGHSASEPGITQALKEAMKSFE